jgi:hypothetical protein
MRTFLEAADPEVLETVRLGQVEGPAGLDREDRSGKV